MTEVIAPGRSHGTRAGVPNNLLPPDVASLAPFVNTSIHQSSWADVRDSMKALMKHAVRLSKENDDVEVQAFSGEADPRIWNLCSEDLLEALANGMKYNHMVGPVVCTDRGENAILRALAKYPESVNLRIFATRYPYHWVRLTWHDDGKRLFDLRGEAYHAPLSDSRWTYEVLLNDRDDPHRADKLLMWYSREQNFTENVPITREVKSKEELDLITLDQLRRVLEQVGPAKDSFGVHPYDLLTRAQILEKARN